MSKRGFNQDEKECPICGSLIWGKGQTVLLEGAKITVCQVCAKHGQKIHERPPSNINVRYKTRQSTQKKKIRRPEESLEKEIVEDYAKRIRNTRTKNNLTQEQFAQKINEKPSLLRRIEAGKAKPTIKLAKKLEKSYDILLLKEADEIEVNTSQFMKKSTGTSLGDIAFIKKKKNDD
ncbi:MAG: multiprotein bridging factor aMBF1 [Promethearchaeota archaeon]